MDMLARVVRENFLECNFMSEDMDAELKLAMQNTKQGIPARGSGKRKELKMEKSQETLSERSSDLAFSVTEIHFLEC